MLWGPAVLAFLVSLAVVRLLLTRFARLALDQPNERSLHDRPVPRTGGIAVMAGAASAWLWISPQLWLPLIRALGLGAVSLLDDVRGMSRRLRLALHVGAAGVLCWYVLSPINALELVLLVIAVVWVTNLYNFMDGSDGLAGGMALIGFSAYAIGAGTAGQVTLAMLCSAIGAGAAAFLLHNFHPARIFLGDVGSIPLGFLAATLGILGWRNDAWPLWFPLLVFGPFIADATVTLLRRLIRGERVWRAHREHYYQRMVLMGLGHRGTALVLYLLMLGCAGAALLGRTQPPVIQALAFLAGTAALAAAAVWADLRWARFARGNEKSA
jgi:UDP-N-acetylmuramyl pentapeptide phosphotransferase/UDP-N-acetylglucosamine-1-phosphate transferase